MLRNMTSACVALATLVSLVALPAQPASADMVLIDFSDLAAAPTLGGTWNQVPDLTSSGLALLNTAGGATGWTLSLSLTGGTQFEFDQGPWANGDVDWIDGDAATDVFGFDGASTVTFNGLVPNGTYRFDHLAARNFSATADYIIGGSFGDSTPSGDDFDSQIDGFTNGSFITWNTVTADGSGQLVLDITDLNTFGYLSASRLTGPTAAVPEPSTAVLLSIALAGMFAVRRR